MLFAVLFTLASCTKFKDGKYIVLNIKSHDDQFNTLPKCSDDTINGKSIGGFLSEKFKQKRYDLKFKEDLVIIKDVQEEEDTILALTSDAQGDYYSTDLSKGEEKLHIELRPNPSKSGLVLIVDLNVPWDMRYRPVQLGGKFVGGGPCGRAISYLSKLD
ncbi:hypothetical protein OQZ33_00470 [Pedobacter sp. MC2016-05]|uniref:hypothetical protein n=1 Tax=Pedobacter sp. MC2016-05 TaxID=2994474 RepID=UPI0022463D16|nr:hypothetical protein [Pedobacter sp. MC2016-05]MCX2472792.1 hypothetical protein [Pedobacter sp. MC2016-05]